MPRMRSLVGTIVGLAVVGCVATQQAAAGPAALAGPGTLPAKGSMASLGAGGSTAGGASDDLLVMLERGDGKGIALPVNGQMSFGLDYEYRTEEDVVFEVAETGSLASGYDDHRVMVRAHWRF